MESSNCGLSSCLWLKAIAQFSSHQMSNNLGIGLRRERETVGFKICFQVTEIFDDTIVNHCDIRRKMRVSVDFNRSTMGRPAGVAYANSS